MWILFFIFQTLAAALACVYFLKSLAGDGRKTAGFDARRDKRLRAMRRISLAPPLTERLRPQSGAELVGQAEAVGAMRAALFGKNPQHIILYGPPGVGKTCAARLIFAEAKCSRHSAFRKNAPFVELDCACLRFDERGTADPLMGSVHDPIYQGAGEMGACGMPAPKEGAVTRAHGGVLFLDEIGEMHASHMNRLLKVLEERRVRLESAYYDPGDPTLPYYIRSAFEKGLPADFRLIAATTRAPSELPQALRSRCTEILFRPLGRAEKKKIARAAARSAGFCLSDEAADRVSQCAFSGRECISALQLAMGRAAACGRGAPTDADFRWAAESGALVKRPLPAGRRRDHARRGVVYALAVTASGEGAVLRVEAGVCPGAGRLILSGASEEEAVRADAYRRVKRTGCMRSACENARMLLRLRGYALENSDICINFPGGQFADGLSAGAAIAIAIASFVDDRPVRADAAITGEISLTGEILPVGGMSAKLDAAERCALSCVFAPVRAEKAPKGLTVLPVRRFEDAYSGMTAAHGA